MRCNPLRWLWGLIPISMLALLAHHWERTPIETDLADRSRAALEQLGFDWAETSFSGRDALLTGHATEEDAPKTATQAVRGVWGVRVVKARTDLVDAVERYSWKASVSDKKLTLSGFVPNQRMRRSIVGMVKASFPKLAVADEMKIARGAPKSDVWLGGIGFAMKQLESLKSGDVSLAGSEYSIAGEAIDQASYKSLKSAVAGLPSGWTLGSEKIMPPVASPFIWRAKLAASQVVLSGTVPSEPVREEIFARAKKAFPRRAVVDRTELASGAPEGWAAAATAGLDQLYQLQEGMVEIKDANAALTGVAVNEETADTVRRAFKSGVPGNFKTREEVTFLKPRLASVAVFETTVDARGDAVEISGYAPGEAEHMGLVEAVRKAFPGRQVKDRIELAAGAPEGWPACMAAATAAIAKVGAGMASLSGNAIEVSGETQDADVAAAIGRTLPSEVGSGCMPSTKITVNVPKEPNLWWRAERGEGVVLLEGEVPDASARAALAATAASLFPGARIYDRMTVVSKRSSTWSKVTEAALRSLARLRKGSASLYLDDVFVKGEAPDAAAADAVRQSLAADLPQGYRGREAISVRQEGASAAEAAARKAAEEAARRAASEREAQRKAEEQAAAARAKAEEDAKARQVRKDEASRCERLIRDAAASGRILFEYASDKLDADSKPTLDELVRLAGGCPSARIVIEGHTSSDGDPERNQKLSERRAQAVADYLRDAGVPAGRLSAEGYGASRPIAPNDTNVNMGKNRRIEFRVTTD